jgi:Dockerin type I domain
MRFSTRKDSAMRWLLDFFLVPVSVAAAVICAAMAGAGSVEAATLIVTTAANSGAGSLRNAIAAASDGDIIEFDPALNGQTITLTSGQLSINRNITISGPGPDLLAVLRPSNFGRFRIFYIMPSHTVTIAGMTISGGYEGLGGGIHNDQATLIISNCTLLGNVSDAGVGGGGIFNTGTLTIISTSVSSNWAGYTTGNPFGNGGGIYNGGGTLEIIDSTITGNTALIVGGGIFDSGGTLTITDSTVSGNRAGSDFLTGSGIGGGIISDGTLVIRNSTLSGNTARGRESGDGGAIYNSDGGVLTITNSTLSGNFANENGGGIYNFRAGAVAEVTNSTLSDNTATNGGSIYNTEGATLQIGNTILKAVAPGGNIFNNGGMITSHGYNLSSDNGGGFLTANGDQINTDPMLGPLQDNGGPTFTHALLSGSLAINAGDPNFTPPPFSDQRGYHRVFNGRIDIGSLEVQPAPTPTPTPPATATPTATATATATTTATATPVATVTPSPTPLVSISGTLLYCSNPVPEPVPNVMLTLTGTTSGSTLTDGSGNYTFSSLVSGGNYTITPTKAARVPGSASINTVDVIAVQRHFLNLGTPLSGCRLTAADVNGDSAVNTVDAIAIQRFFLGLSTGIANTGKYQFTPVNRSYTGIVRNQTAQNYDTLVFGDVAVGFVELVDSSSQTAADDGTGAGETAATVAAITLSPR